MYRISYAKLAIRALRRMPKNVAQLIQEKIYLLAEDPTRNNLNIKKLIGTNGYRLRVGDWRIIYEINNQELIVLVLKIGTRGDIYK